MASLPDHTEVYPQHGLKECIGNKVDLKLCTMPSLMYWRKNIDELLVFVVSAFALAAKGRDQLTSIQGGEFLVEQPREQLQWP